MNDKNNIKFINTNISSKRQKKKQKTNVLHSIKKRKRNVYFKKYLNVYFTKIYFMQRLQYSQYH